MAKKTKQESIIDGRVMPHSIEAERAVLGSMLLANSSIPSVIELLKVIHFYHTPHRVIYDAIIKLSDLNPVDLLTLTEELSIRNQLEAVGGPAYLAGLEQSVTSTSNARHYAEIVFKKFQLRELIQTAHEITEEAYSEVEGVDNVLNMAEKKVFEISQQRASRDFVRIDHIIHEALDEIEHRHHNSGDVLGLATGFKDLDDLTSGLHNTDLVIIAGRPSTGKTAFAINIATNVGLYLNKPVGIFSLEMSASQLNQRMISAVSRVDSNKIRTGRLQSIELERIHRASGTLSNSPIYIDDTPGLNVLEVRAKARRLKAENNDISLILIDYLQLMTGTSRNENRQQEIAEISRSLKVLARELNVPIIALSQLSRLIEQRKGKDKRPILSDLRESGAIEQDADVVMFVHRELMGSADSPDNIDKSKIAEIIIGKQRNGPVGSIKLAFLKEFTKFENLAKDTDFEY